MGIISLKNYKKPEPIENISFPAKKTRINELERIVMELEFDDYHAIMGEFNKKLELNKFLDLPYEPIQKLMDFFNSIRYWDGNKNM